MTFDKILVSPLKRAVRTAEIINETYGIELIQEPLLMEHDNGIIAGMKKEDVHAKYPLPDYLSTCSELHDNFTTLRQAQDIAKTQRSQRSLVTTQLKIFNKNL